MFNVYSESVFDIRTRKVQKAFVRHDGRAKEESDRLLMMLARRSLAVQYGTYASFSPKIYKQLSEISSGNRITYAKHSLIPPGSHRSHHA